MLYNVYCDETCHLENDGINVMVLGAVWCSQSKLKEINQRIKEIKARNNVSPSMELKWTKISPGKLDLYKDLVNYYFDDDDLHFRALIIPDKSKLDHQRFNQTHDDWYYKMYFDMLKVIFHPTDRFEVYIDIKDSNSYQKAQKLREVCSNSMYDFSQSVIHRLQPIRSEEVQIMQLTDILIGAIAYENRSFPDGFQKSSAKQVFIQLKTTRRKPFITSPVRTTSKTETASLISEDAKGSAGSEHLLRTMTVIRQNVQIVTESKYGRNHIRIISGFTCFLRRKGISLSLKDGKTMCC